MTVAAGPEEVRLRADAALHGSWLRSAVEGAPVVISFRPDDMQARLARIRCPPVHHMRGKCTMNETIDGRSV